MRALYITILAATAVFAGGATNSACKTGCVGESPAADLRCIEDEMARFMGIPEKMKEAIW